MKKTAVVVIHIGYWLLYFTLISLFVLVSLKLEGTLNIKNYVHLLLMSPLFCLCFIPSLMGFYFFYKYLFPKYFLKKKIGSMILSGLSAVTIISILTSLLVSAIFGQKTLFNDGLISFFSISFVIILITLFHGVVAIIIRGFITSYSDITIKEELNRKNYDTELELIKSKINPHFLFNTINNIDTLIHKDPSRASAYLNKLSDIMRFTLYETNTSKIPLNAELEYIGKYVELQKIRSSNINYVKYEVSGEIDSLLIEPMLFIPFIENAFKYSENIKNSSTVFIKFLITGTEIIFECNNEYDINEITDTKNGGLGNEITKKRLELLYPNSHKLDITKNNNIYNVNLTITRHDN